MKKLKLALDRLQVASFATAEARGEHGTVMAHASPTTIPPTRFDDTCWASCIPGCGTYKCTF